jgi:hypothetical protein
MSSLLLMLIVAVLGLLCVAGLIALVVWLVRRTQPGTGPTEASEAHSPLD